LELEPQSLIYSTYVDGQFLIEHRWTELGQKLADSKDATVLNEFVPGLRYAKGSSRSLRRAYPCPFRAVALDCAAGL